MHISKCFPSPFDEEIPTYFLHAVNFCARVGIFDLQAGSPKTGTKKTRLVVSKKLGRGPMTGGYKNFLLASASIIPKKLFITQIRECILKKFRAFIVKRDL